MSYLPLVHFGRKRRSYTLLAVLLISLTSVTTSYRDRRNHVSTPVECARNCVEGEAPKICYWHFAFETYTTMGPACDLGVSTPNASSIVSEFTDECVLCDGVEKPVLTINRRIPGPSIQVCKGDIIVVDYEIRSEGYDSTIHWHGVFQEDSQYYDGVPYVTQCPILSGSTFRYQFQANNAGTHFWHSHDRDQMADGISGSLIVREPRTVDPQARLYDLDRIEDIIFLTDLFHVPAVVRHPGRYQRDRGQTAENFLINGWGTWTDPASNNTTQVPLTTFTVEPGKRHRFRLINSFSTVCLSSFTIENHPLTIIAQDGENIVPVTVDKIVTASGERVDFVLEAKQTVNTYWIHLQGLGECREKQVHQSAILRYKGGPEQPPTPKPQYSFGSSRAVTYNPPNAADCSANPETFHCIHQLKALEDSDERLFEVYPDVLIVLNFDFRDMKSSEFKAGFLERFFVAVDKTILHSRMSNISFEGPSAPLISQSEGYAKLCNPSHLPNYCTEYCSCTHAYNIPLNAVVELVIYDKSPLTDLNHPFHLHGYAFKVFEISQVGSQPMQGDFESVYEKHQTNLKNGYYKRPPGKDTLVVPEGGITIVRFIADNPGWWLYHCHFVWHTMTGMDVVFHVGTQEDLPPVPQGFPRCNNFLPPVDYDKYIRGGY